MELNTGCELVITGDLTPRWVCWFASMAFFLYIVYELLVGLSAATASEADPAVAGKIKTAQVMTVISCCTYHVVYLFPMLGVQAAHAVVFIQLGYCWWSVSLIVDRQKSPCSWLHP